MRWAPRLIFSMKTKKNKKNKMKLMSANPKGRPRCRRNAETPLYAKIRRLPDGRRLRGRRLIKTKGSGPRYALECWAPPSARIYHKVGGHAGRPRTISHVVVNRFFESRKLLLPYRVAKRNLSNLFPDPALCVYVSVCVCVDAEKSRFRDVNSSAPQTNIV